ncbi:MAG: hypothetical protein LBC88_01650 [Spirochaetaceae bacterium]|jgi:hypothetical protein|nr:hypothetical protein [Spirochaetaceae bacterium]
MHRKCIVFICAILLPVRASALDFVVQYYAPTLFGIASGTAASLDLFENQESDSRFLLPVESKLLALRFGAFAFSFNTIVSVYSEDRAFGSLNLSVGAGLYLNRRETSPLRGWYIALYPLYELPVIAPGKQPFWDWRAALDLGFSADVFGPLYISFFTRIFAALRGAEWTFLPDAGIAVGLHFR